MKTAKRILIGLSAILALAVVSLAIALSYNAPCGNADALPNDTTRMKAVVFRCYGPPSVLKMEEIAKPTPADDEVLVKVHAVGLNPLDWHNMRGSPYFLRLSDGLGQPKSVRIGFDFAGTVEAVGRNVARFKPGDDVFGGRSGALAEYVVVREDRGIVIKPANLSFEQAAAVTIAGVTAIQGLRDKGRLEPGHKVLINGASGGVGTFAVQIAKQLGAEVTAVCSTRNVELVRSLGADHVVDYTQQDFVQGEQRYDMILDNVGNRSLSDYRRVLKEDGALVIVGGPKGDWFGMIMLPIKAALMSMFVDQRLGMFMASANRDDLTILSDFMQAGKLTPVIDKRYPFNEVAAAMAYLEEGRARGKVVVNVH